MRPMSVDFIYLFIYSQFIYRWQILFQFTIRLTFPYYLSFRISEYQIQ